MTLGRALVTVALATSVAGAEPLADALQHSRYPVAVKGGKLDGAGAVVLRTAIDDAQFVMLGEDHGIAQIPQFAAALCDELAPHGFHRLALEVGPSVGPELERILRAPDPAAASAAFTKKFPETVAFYDWQEELAFLTACSKATAATPLQIWGVDQELMGAAVSILPKILATRPGPKGQAAIEALVREDAADRIAAAKTGDFSALLLLKARAATLEAARAALAKDGSAEAQRLFGALLESRAIYEGQASPTPYVSNVRRAKLMKETFFDDLSAAASVDHAMPKVLLKLGAWHLYRGMNPLHSSELGDLVAEAAAAHKLLAVNVLVLGVKGQQLRPAGVGRPDQAAALDLASDADFKFLAPLLAAQRAEGWTLFDLRALRPIFGKLGKVDPELERLIFGYDFAVLIPDPKPAHH